MHSFNPENRATLDDLQMFLADYENYMYKTTFIDENAKFEALAKIEEE
jgi:hypothetical protein